MSNTVYYEMLMGGSVRTLKERLGTVAAQSQVGQLASFAAGPQQ